MRRRTLRWLAISAAMAWLAWSPPAPEATAAGRWPRPVVKAFRSIKEKECLRHVAVLASDGYEGRATGTEGGRKAQEYVADAFRAMGLEPGGVNGSYFQPFSVRMRRIQPGPMELGNVLGVQKKRGEKLDSLRFGKDFVPDGRSGEMPAGGQLVFLGREDGSLAAPAGVETAGFVAVLLAAETPSPVAVLNVLAAAGARAVVLVDPTTKEFEKDAWPMGTREEAAKIPVLRTTARAGDKLLKRLGTSLRSVSAKPDERVPPNDALATIDVSRRGYAYGRGRNVIGVFPGHDPELREEVIVIGAHVDHVGKPTSKGLTRGTLGKIHNGADDNASGTSGLIELAEAFARSDLEPKRTIVFIAFDAEETGLLGSKYYVADPPRFPIEKTRAMINMDMISRNDILLMKIGKKDEFAGLNEIVASVAAEFNITLDPEGMDQYLQRSDQWPFIQAGVPAVFLYGGEHPEYHTERDDVERITPAKIVNISRLMFLSAWESANHEGSFKE